MEIVDEDKFLQYLLDNDASVNFKDGKALSALQIAIENRMTRIIDFLIDRNTNSKFCDKNDNTILHFLITKEFLKFRKLAGSEWYIPNNSVRDSIIHESTDFIEWMLSKLSEHIDCQNMDGDTVLHLVAKYNLLHVVPIILKHSKSVTIVNNLGKTAFQVLLEPFFDRNPIVSHIHMNLDMVYPLNFIPMKYYRYPYFEQICENFLDKGFSVDVVHEHGNTLVHCALKTRLPSLAKLILKFSQNVDAQDVTGDTALNIIMSYGKYLTHYKKTHEQMVQCLLSKGADVHKPNESNFSPLVTAVQNRKLSMLKMFVEHGVNFCRSDSMSLLHHFFTAKFEGDKKTNEAVFDLLVNQGCDVNARDRENRTPLHFAIESNDVEIVMRLLDRGAGVNVRSSIFELTPLHKAIMSKRKALVKLLIISGAEVNVRNCLGNSGLHMLANGMEDAVEDLIRSGARLDARNNDGYFPLQLAILKNDDRVMKRLVEFGADINDSAHVLSVKNVGRLPKFAIEHLIKMRVAGLHIDDELRGQLESTLNILFVQEMCCDEIEKLKSYKIDHSTSLYDLLRMNKNFVCTFVNNEELKKLIHSASFEEKFPMYNIIISFTYNMAMERRELLEPAKLAWYELTNIKLPDLCVYEILSYVSNTDLRVMVTDRE